MRSYEFSAKSIDKAIKEGLTLLNRKQEDVDIKIVTEGGLFKKAKIVITTDEPDEVKPEPKVEVKAEPAKVAKPKAEKEAVKAKPAKAEAKKEEPQPAVKIQEVKIEKPEEPREKRLDNTSSKQFLEGLLKSIQIEAEVAVKETEEASVVSIHSAAAGNLIGHRGDGLNALQYLSNVIEEKRSPKSKHVVLDIEGYKERREESLKGLAKRCADKVLKTQKPYKLEPMNAYERRIIHTELQSIEGITTISIGEEPNRRIVIDIKK